MYAYILGIVIVIIIIIIIIHLLDIIIVIVIISITHYRQHHLRKGHLRLLYDMMI